MLSKPQENTLKQYLFIREYIGKHGYSPSIREIGEYMGHKSVNTTQYHMQKLLRLGWIETDIFANGKMCPRAYRLGKNPLEN